MAALKRLNKKSWSSIEKNFKKYKVFEQNINNKFSASEKLHKQIRYIKYRERKSGADYKCQILWLHLLDEKRRIKELLNSYPIFGILWRKISYIPSRGLMLKIRFVKK